MNQSTEKGASLRLATGAVEHDSPNFTKIAQEILEKTKKPTHFEDFIISCMLTICDNTEDLKKSEIGDILLSLALILRKIVVPLQKSPANSTAIIAGALHETCKHFGPEVIVDQMKKILTMSLQTDYNHFSRYAKKNVSIFECLLKIA